MLTLAGPAASEVGPLETLRKLALAYQTCFWQLFFGGAGWVWARVRRAPA